MTNTNHPISSDGTIESIRESIEEIRAYSQKSISKNGSTVAVLVGMMIQLIGFVWFVAGIYNQVLQHAKDIETLRKNHSEVVSFRDQQIRDIHKLQMDVIQQVAGITAQLHNLAISITRLEIQINSDKLKSPPKEQVP